MLLVEAPTATAAETCARQIAERKFGCTVIVDHAVPCPGFTASAQSLA
jgi:hypothetical protein